MDSPKTKDQQEPLEPIRKLSELLELDGEGRASHQLRMLDGLFSRAVKAEKYADALKIMAEARTLLHRYGKR